MAKANPNTSNATGRKRYASSSEKARVQIAENQTITRKQHDELVAYINKRLEFGNQMRKPLIDRFKIIDREVAGYLVLDADDTKRQIDNIAGYGPKVVDVIIPLVLSQCDEAVTFLLSVLVPDEAMYQAIAPKDKQSAAAGFASLLNKHGAKFKHFKNYSRFLFDAMKYNLSGVEVDWVKQIGAKIENAAGGVGISVVEEEVAAGNELTALDMYNTIFDPSVPLTETANKGEFFATISLHTPFRVKKMAMEKEIFNIEKLGEGNFTRLYYEQKPIVRNDGTSVTNLTDWVDILSSGAVKGVSEGVEFATVSIWLPVKQFGLGQEDELQIWRITIAINGTTNQSGQIVLAERLSNAHGMLPVAVAMPWEDGLGIQTKSYAELLIPYQRFASFQMNVHQRAARKALYGVTLYDKQAAPLMENADILGGKCPVNPMGNDRDIRKSVFQFNDAPDTSNTLRDIDAVDALMQKILPTDLLRQVTDLERATQFQAAATVQAGNRRNLKIAKIIDSQAMVDIRLMQMYNVFQYQQIMQIIDQEGNLIQIDPGAMRDANIEFDISDGLKGLDKLSVITFYKDLLNAALQSQQINENMDLVSLLNYMSSIIGDETDISQFKFKTEFDKLNPQEKQLAFELLQQATAAAEQGAEGPIATAAEEVAT